MRKLLCVITMLLSCGYVDNSPPGETGEFCENDTFSARCGDDEVIVMESAKYGRMDFGKCLTTEYGTRTCFVDATPRFHHWCSGRVHCEVKVHTLVEIMQPCDKNLRSHLTASYRCLKVYHHKQQCFPGESVLLPTHHSSVGYHGYLSSYVSQKTTCGSIDSPWRIQAQPGQRINLTLIDFSAVNQVARHSGGTRGACQVLVVIKEEGRQPPSETVCGGAVRNASVFTSSSHELEIRFLPRSQQEEVHFLVYYEVIGCPNLRVSSDTAVIYSSTGAVVTCQGQEHWKIQCRNHHWHGEWHNCTDSPVVEGSVGAVMFSVTSLSYTTSVILVVCIALVIGVCVTVLGLCYVKRKRQNHAPHYAESYTSKEMTRPPPPYVESNYTVPDANNSYQDAWTQHRQAQLGMSNTGMSTNRDSYTQGNRDSYQQGNRDSYQQRYQEHIYESPDFHRKNYESQSAPQSLQYYEVEATTVKVKQ